MKTVQLWIYATRPKTLVASIFSVFIAMALSFYHGYFSALPGFFCLSFAVLCQILSNFSNDYYDALKGADDQRIKGPMRLVAAGLIKPNTMYKAIWIVGISAFFTGSWLLFYGPWYLIIIGIACLTFAVTYTKGSFALAYKGLGDIFVFIFFGLVSILGTFYIQTGFICLDAFLIASAYGLLTSNILAITSYRDIETDSLVSKKTPGVRFGRSFVEWQYAISFLVALLIPMALVWYLAFPVSILLTWLVGPLGWRFITQWRQEKEHLCFEYGLKQTVLLLVLYSLILIISLVSYKL